MPEAPFRYGADTYLFELAALFGPLARLDEPQGAYRSHASNGYESRPFLERIGSEVGWYDVIFPALTQLSGRLGLRADERMWREDSWFHRLARAIEELRAVLPSDARIAMGDGGAWGLDDELDGWRFVPFPADRKEYGYAPAGDEHAVAELDALPGRADFFVLAWAAFWWRDSYPGLDAYLREGWECVHASEQAQCYRIS